MPILRPSSGPYRPTWEGAYFDPVAPSEWLAVTGPAPQWSDQSDSTYTWQRFDLYESSPGVIDSPTPLVIADLPAAPGVTEITGVMLRANYLTNAPDQTPSVGWKLRNKATGSVYATGSPSSPLTTTPSDVSVTGGTLPAALAPLQAGSLVVEAYWASGMGTIVVYEMWLVVSGTVPEPPSTTPQAIVPLHASPSLRMLQRGGQGGMSGIPRMIGDPTRRGSLRQGPGSVY